MNSRYNLNRSSLVNAMFILLIALFLVKVPVPFLYGLELLLYPAVSWFVYYRYSLNHAVLITIIASACGIFIWDKSPLLALNPIEILLVGWAASKSKWPAVIWDLVYWLTIGLATFYTTYQWLTDWSYHNTLTIYMFSVAGGLLNIFIGRIAADYLPNTDDGNRKKWRIGRISFHLCMVLLIVPTIIYLLMSGYYTYQKSLDEISTRLDTLYGQVNDRVNNMNETELRNLKVRSAVQKASLQSMFSRISTGTDVQLTLIDTSSNIITTLESNIDEYVAYDWKARGTVKQVAESLYLWQSDDIPSYNKVHRWSNSEFVSVYSLERLPYTLIVKQPATTFQKNMFNLYLLSIVIVGLSTLISAFVAYKVTNHLSMSITGLGHFTTGLPRRIRMRESIEWKDSPLHEVERLRDNFEDMAKELANMFHEINESEERLRQMVHYDTLTGLGNRYSFGLYLPSLIQEAEEKNTKIACLFIDLDRFKSINDSYGHEAGDAVLKEVGKRLKQYDTDQTKAFRLSGDEFVLVIHDPLPDDLLQWAQSVHHQLSDTVFICNDTQIQIELSAGISLYPEHGKDAQSLLRSSDHAMYQAKVSGRNRVKLSSGSNSGFPKRGEAE